MQKAKPSGSAPRRRAWMIPTAMLLLVAGAAIAWALITVLRPAEDPLDAADYTVVTVEEGEVGSSVALGAVAQWDAVPVGMNHAPGIVTGVSVAEGAEVSQGATLYTVDLRPVVVARGDVPAFREITAGTRGADVTQLQDMLRETGFFEGSSDGIVRWSTTSAIRAWQKSLGVEQTGTVRVGDVVFVPSLPVRVVMDTQFISRGVALSGGEAVVRAVGAEPVFTLPATDAQASSIPSGTLVEITSPDGSVWRAISGAHQRDDQAGTVEIPLDPEGSESVCSEQCDQVPVTGKTSLRAQVVTVPTVAGLIVPSSALVTTAAGGIALVDEDGELLPVTVRTSARGMSVVEGVAAGAKVRVPGEQR